jgi:hypothetical protein
MHRNFPGTTEAVKVTMDEKLIDVCGRHGDDEGGDWWSGILGAPVTRPATPGPEGDSDGIDTSEQPGQDAAAAGPNRGVDLTQPGDRYSGEDIPPTDV